MNKIFCIIIYFIALANFSTAQDSLLNDFTDKKFAITAFVTPSIFYLEPCVQIQYFFKNKNSFELKYSYLLFGFNLNNNNNDFPSYQLYQLSGFGSIFRLGYKRPGKNIGHTRKFYFDELRFTHKDLFYPKYCHCEGSASSSNASRRIQSEKKRVEVFNLAFAKHFAESKNFYVEFTGIIGYAFQKVIL